LNFLSSNISKSDFFHACLVTEILSLSFATTGQRSVSQSAPLKDRTSNIFECRQDMIYLIMCDTIRRSSCVFMNVTVWKCCALNN
jgi:hypothetical protein